MSSWGAGESQSANSGARSAAAVRRAAISLQHWAPVAAWKRKPTAAATPAGARRPAASSNLRGGGSVGKKKRLAAPEGNQRIFRWLLRLTRPLGISQD